jgi:benzoylformate decarboxylase
MTARSVRDATFDVFREYGLTSLFANPGSTEVSLLADLPDDLRFVLGLHESTVVGMATGFALGRGEPALAILHTTAGLGNAVSALATARVNRAPLVVVVGQQDRRHLASEPFLAGKLRGLAGEYPVWVDEPVRAQDVPGAVARAYHESVTGRGPALVVVPMDDWVADAGPDEERIAPRRLLRSDGADAAVVEELVAFLASAARPALVAGAGADEPATWPALVALAERLGCPVFQESFGGSVGFPQRHPRFAGHLPGDRERLREVLAPYDAVLVVGAPAFRQYPFFPGTFVGAGTRVAVVSRDPAEVHRSTAELAVLGHPAPVCAELARLLPAREAPGDTTPAVPPQPAAAEDETMRVAHVLAALAERLPADAIVIEESPSSRAELLARLPADRPLGSLSPAMGGLGFAMPAATGLRMALPERPVVAIVGDGSSLYAIQSLWSAAQYRAGALFVVMSNGGYAIMDRLAERTGSPGPWPVIDVEIGALARAFGCPARTVRTYGDLLEALDELAPGLASREEPLLLEVVVAQDETFTP